jgi:hypothetical protein
MSIVSMIVWGAKIIFIVSVALQNFFNKILSTEEELYNEAPEYLNMKDSEIYLLSIESPLTEYENQLNFERQIELFKEIKKKKNSIAI